MYETVNYSAESKAAEVNSQVMISFRVEMDGSVTNLAVVVGVGYGIDEEVMRIIGGLTFAPAIQNKHKVP